MEITASERYLAFLGRQNLNYSYEHFSDSDERLDPSCTNVVDMFVLTTDYYNQVQMWLSAGNWLQPSSPTSYDLETQLSSLDNFKMISDELIYHSADFNYLFGPYTSSPELAANFVIIRAAQSNVSDNEIKNQALAAINTFFALGNFSFGETFYGSELCTYVSQQLATIISSIVIVPTYGQVSSAIFIKFARM